MKFTFSWNNIQHLKAVEYETLGNADLGENFQDILLPTHYLKEKVLMNVGKNGKSDHTGLSEVDFPKVNLYYIPCYI